MSNAEQLQQAPPMELGDDGLYVMRTQMDVFRVADHLLKAGAVPATLGTPQKVAMAVQGLKSLGLNPYAAIRQVAFINGAMTLWGDLPLALARKTGTLEDFEEFLFCIGDAGSYRRQCFVNSNCHLDAYGAVCRLKRQGQAMHEVVFTRSDAEKAGLWNKRGKEGRPTPWVTFPARMMQMRARSQALKDVFSDALAGVQIQEFDLEGVGPSGPTLAAPAAAAALPHRQRGGHIGRELLAQFGAQGITPGHVETYLGHSTRKCTVEELESLRELAVALANEDINWADALDARKQLLAQPRADQDSTAQEQSFSPPQPPKHAMEQEEASPPLRKAQVLAQQLKHQTRGRAGTL